MGRINLSVEGIKIGLLFVDVVVLLASSDCDLQLSLEQFVLLQCEELLSSQDELSASLSKIMAIS